MATVIEAYCDESGIHDGAAKCVVVGWVAAARHWAQFEERWRRASGGVDFHGKRFFARDDSGQRVKPYEGWYDDEARAYLLRLVEVITTSSVKPIGAVVDVKDFQARTESERKWLTGATYSPEFRKWEDSGSPNRPYYLGFNECIENAAARVKNPKWKVSFYFDQQNVLAPYALEYFKRAKCWSGRIAGGRHARARLLSKGFNTGRQARGIGSRNRALAANNSSSYLPLP